MNTDPDDAMALTPIKRALLEILDTAVTRDCI